MIVDRSPHAKGFLELCAIVTDRLWRRRRPYTTAIATAGFKDGFIGVKFHFDPHHERRDVMFSVMEQIAEDWDR